MSRSLKSHKRFKHASPSLCVQLQHTDYHVLYTTSKFEAATTTTLNYILQPFTIFDPVFISILKLYTFHTMDNRKHFFRNYLVQHLVQDRYVKTKIGNNYKLLNTNCYDTNKQIYNTIYEQSI